MQLQRTHIWLIAGALCLAFLTATLLSTGGVDPKNGAPRVLVSLDRSLWNRLRLNRWTYVRSIKQAGMTPVLVDYEFVADNAETIMQNIDGLILSGGGDVGAVHYQGNPQISREVNPARDDFELALLAAADDKGIPVLGICRGAQLINVYHGGTLGDFRHDSRKYDVHHRVWGGHPVNLKPDTRLAGIFGTAELASVVSYHGQYVDQPGRGVDVVAYAPDGTPEAIEVGDQWGFGMIGVQWHAEVRPRDLLQKDLFKALAAAAARHREATKAVDQSQAPGQESILSSPAH